MKKVITTVGTSIFTNCADKADYKDLIDLSHNQWENESRKRDSLRKKVLNSNRFRNEDASAEVQSLLAIANRYKEEELDIYLLATDTVLSRLAAELVKVWFEENNFKVYFTPQYDVIDGLQIKSLVEYRKKGFPNLISRIQKIANNGNWWGDIVFNLTGGYKGIIPILTTIAQVEQVPSFYIFQEEASIKPDLIEIPPVPLEVKTELFEKYLSDFQKITSDLFDLSSFSEEFKKSTWPLLYEEEGFLRLNEFCQVLWHKFRHNHFIFYASDEIYSQITQQANIQRILSQKLWSPHVRHGASVEVKGEHRHVYDDGKNGNRIYFFEDRSEVFIYKTFDTDHSGHVKFLKTPFTDDLRRQILETATIRVIKIDN